MKHHWRRPILFVAAGALALGLPSGLMLGSFAADAMNPFYAMDAAPRQTVQQPELDPSAVDPLVSRPAPTLADGSLDAPVSTDGAYPSQSREPAPTDASFNAR